MPGVPSGRACEGCRKQKKKCDEKTPCSRCLRLDMICVGSGKQRYKFKEQRGLRNGHKNGAIMICTNPNGGNGRDLTPNNGPTAMIRPRKENLMSHTPNNALTSLAGSFIETIKTSTGLRYNLAWTYGFFLEDIPSRLGINQALDSSIDALVSAHSSWCSRREVSIDALTKYCRALKTLRQCLDDPVKASASETLCAVMMLLICQVFVGVHGSRNTCHGEGAAQILKARGYYNKKDDFECKLLLSLRGSVLFEGLVNNKIQFTVEEWKTLVENKLDGDTDEGQMLRCLARVPDFMQRGRRAVSKGYYKGSELLDEARTNYWTLRTVLQRLRDRLDSVQTRIANGILDVAIAEQAHAHFQRSYALCLAINIILNCILSAIDKEDTQLNSESTCLSEEILSVAEAATKYRPVGSSYVGLCLMAAWVGTTDCELRALIERVLAEYQGDFPLQGEVTSIAALEEMSRQLHLIDTNVASQ